MASSRREKEVLNQDNMQINMNSMKEDDIDDLFQDEDDIKPIGDYQHLIVYSRDWTIQTIFDQIEQKNIELNPAFQRRNAWTDSKRSKLIESILIGYPVPEIVLAQDIKNKGSFIVIDGKQRLLTIAGYIDNAKYKYWKSKKPRLTNLKGDGKYCGLSYAQILDNPNLRRIFENSALRCTVISNFQSEDELYDIFYRLNAGSTPLATQELRQALYRGEFSDLLIHLTNEDNPIRQVMNLDAPDNRLRDVDVYLRLICFLLRAKKYNGNLLCFLNESLKEGNERWLFEKQMILGAVEKIEKSVQLLIRAYGNISKVGRRFKDGELESRFNRVLLEVEVVYFSQMLGKDFSQSQHNSFMGRLKELCNADVAFAATLEGSTKNMENYRVRYNSMKKIIEESYGVILTNPFADEE